MIVYHFVYDLDAFTSVPVHSNTLLWNLVGKSSALLFIFLSGISSNLSRHPLYNGARLLCWALIVTLVTYIGIPKMYVRFGILHFLGIMLLLYPIFKARSSIFLLIFSILAVLLGLFITHILGTVPWLLAFGLTYPGFSTIDYYPLFPYSGIFIIGIIFYRICYASSHNFIRLSLPPLLEKMSRHSLLIYILHQPILLLFIYMVKNL